MTAKKKDTTLSTLFREPETIPSSIGDISVNRFKLKHIAKVNIYLAEIFKALKFDTDIDIVNGNIGDAFKGMDFGYLLYILAEQDSECLMVLLECATDKSRAELGELDDAEAVVLIKSVFQVSVMSMLKQLGNGMGVKLNADLPA
jgi:hypothetical protein